MIVAIDGPCGSGKGTIAKKLEERLNLINIDTGATYRCVALSVLNNNIKLEDEEKIIEISKDIDVKFNDHKVYLNDEDVTKRIRDNDVTAIVSPVSRIVKVRENMVELQRKLASTNDVVLEGRDITTVVFPNAEYKFYLDASLEARAHRRYEENQEKGIDMTYEEVKENTKNYKNKEKG